MQSGASGDSVITVNSSGVIRKRNASAFGSSATTHSMSLSGNTLTSTVNGTTATASTVGSVSNTSSTNSLSTTVNGISSSAVNIINSNALNSSTNTLTSTVNGVAATGVNIINSNATSLSGTNLTTTVNGVAATALDLSPAITSKAWSLTGNSGTSYSTNFLGTTDNKSLRFRTNNTARMIVDSLGNVGIGTTTPAYALEVSAASNPVKLTGLQSGAAADSVMTINSSNIVKKRTVANLLSSGTTHTLSSSTNTLTSTVNGVTATASAVNSVSNTSSANNLSTTVNGVAGSNVSIINTNATSLSGTNLTTTVNGVAATALDISPAIISTAWSKTGNSGTTAGTNYVGTSDAVDFVAKTNATERMRITSAGNVGINNTAAATLLNVTKSTAAAPATSGTASTAIARFDAQNNALDIGAYTASPYGNWLQATAVNNLATNQPLVLNPNGGNIGIGVASPSYALSFSGQASKQIWMERNTTAATAGNDLTVQSSGSTSASTNKAGGNLYLNSGTSTGTGTSDVYIGTATAGSSGTTDNAPSTKVYIKGNGMVGIGHSTPLANVSIYGTTNSGFSPTCWGGTSSGPEISFSRGGFYTVGASIQMIDYNAYSSGLSFNVHKGTNNGGGGTFADNWPTDVVQAVTIDNKGYTGIGQNIPTSTLHVNGSVAASVASKSSSYTLTATDYCVIFTGSTASQTLTLPAASSSTGRIYILSNTATVAVSATSIKVGSAASTTISLGSGSNLQVISDGTNWVKIN